MSNFGVGRRVIERHHTLVDHDKPVTFTDVVKVETAPVDGKDVVNREYLDATISNLQRNKVHENCSAFIASVEDVPTEVGVRFIPTSTMTITEDVFNRDVRGNDLLRGVPYTITAEGYVGDDQGIQRGDLATVEGVTYILRQGRLELGGWEQLIDASDLDQRVADIKSGADEKEYVEYVISGPVALSGVPDGYTADEIDGKRLLVVGNEDATQDRVYIGNATGAWDIAADCGNGVDATGNAVWVAKGDEANQVYRQALPNAIYSTSPLQWRRWYSRDTNTTSSSSVVKTGTSFTVNPPALEAGGDAEIEGTKVKVTATPVENSYVPVVTTGSQATSTEELGAHLNGIGLALKDVRVSADRLRTDDYTATLTPSNLSTRSVQIEVPASYAIDAAEIGSSTMFWLGSSSKHGRGFIINATTAVASWDESSFLYSETEGHGAQVGDSLSFVFPVR